MAQKQNPYRQLDWIGYEKKHNSPGHRAPWGELIVGGGCNKRPSKTSKRLKPKIKRASRK